MSYTNEQLVSEAVETFFRENNLGVDGGLNKNWAKIKIGKIYLPLYNPPARRKALVFHDIHHAATGYKGDWEGEVSISAWELASGCGNYIAAWGLDLWAVAIGLFIYPQSVFRAFIRGKNTKNLYHNNISHETAFSLKISEMQDRLLLSTYVEKTPTAKEKLSFAFYAVLALIWAVVPFIIIPAAFLYYLLK
jgi:hypothetical protein